MNHEHEAAGGESAADWDELRDRLVDLGLRESLAHEEPPDHTAEILAAVQAGPAEKGIAWESVTRDVSAGGAAAATPRVARLGNADRTDAPIAPSRRELALAGCVLILIAGGLAALLLPGSRPPRNELARSVQRDQDDFKSLLQLIRDTIEVDTFDCEINPEGSSTHFVHGVPRSRSTIESDRAKRVEAVLKTLFEVKKDFVPFPEDPPTVYPNRAAWDQLQLLHSMYATTDRSRHGSPGRFSTVRPSEPPPPLTGAVYPVQDLVLPLLTSKALAYHDVRNVDRGISLNEPESPTNRPYYTLVKPVWENSKQQASAYTVKKPEYESKSDEAGLSGESSSRRYVRISALPFFSQTQNPESQQAEARSLMSLATPKIGIINEPTENQDATRQLELNEHFNDVVVRSEEMFQPLGVARRLAERKEQLELDPFADGSDRLALGSRTNPNTVVEMIKDSDGDSALLERWSSLMRENEDWTWTAGGEGRIEGNDVKLSAVVGWQINALEGRKVPKQDEAAKGLAALDFFVVNPADAPEPKKPESPEGRGPGEGGDRYRRIVENEFLASLVNPLSTFSIDVDTASYANTRQFLMQQNTLPPPDAVRIEELVNYFQYDYAEPKDDRPFAVHVELAGCPWRPEHRLARIAIKGREVSTDKRPRANLVFLIDVSGSMNESAKLPLLVSAMKLLTEQLRDDDSVAIVVYAGNEGLVLPATPGQQRQAVLAALDKLSAGGSTNGGAGIELAYKIAKENFIAGAINRVILCTDGDFNVGTTSDAALERLIEEKAKTGTYLTVLGFGRGNFNDSLLEAIAGRGNGNYAYVDNLREARKVLVEQLSGTLLTIAKDVKIQVEFNPAKVAGYRLLGYEDRKLAAEDFNNDQKDAGEIGAGHTVTALYELVPAGKPVETPPVEPLRYQSPHHLTDAAKRNEALTVKLRYKEPEEEKSKLIEVPVSDRTTDFAKASGDFQFAAAVAALGMLLRDSQYKGAVSYDAVLEIAAPHRGDDKDGHRNEFLELVRRAKQIAAAQK